MSHTILDVDDIEATNMSLPRCDNTDTTQVMATSNHAQIASLKLDKIDDLA